MTPESIGMQPAWIVAIIYTMLVIGALYLLPFLVRWVWHLSERSEDDDE